MGLLDQVVGGLLANSGTSGSPIQGVLMGLLGGNQQQGGGYGNQAGGLSGLVSSFEQAGLGHIAQSWIGNGPNQPVSPSQLQSVFGTERVQSMASQAGMQPEGFLQQLSQHLPQAVDGMSPNGHADEGTMSV